MLWFPGVGSKGLPWFFYFRFSKFTGVMDAGTEVPLPSRNGCDIPDRIPASRTPLSRKGVSPSLSVAKVPLTSQACTVSQEYSKVRYKRKVTIALGVTARGDKKLAGLLLQAGSRA